MNTRHRLSTASRRDVKVKIGLEEKLSIEAVSCEADKVPVKVPNRSHVPLMY